LYYTASGIITPYRWPPSVNSPQEFEGVAVAKIGHCISSSSF